jgi:hypothetical protein
VNSQRFTVQVRHPEWWIDSLIGKALDPSDAIVITGYWRSGTTWLLQSLSEEIGAKSVFEPLHPGIPAYRRAVISDYSPEREDSAYLNMYMPYEDGSLDPSLKLYSYLRRALTGQVTEPWVQGPRRRSRHRQEMASEFKLLDVPYRIREALKTTIVTKFVRGHLLIPTLLSTFSPCIFHIRRDPRAIAASFQRRGWDWHQDLSLEDQLLRPNDGRTEYFDRWASLICEYDAAAPLIRIAVYWLLLENFVDQVAAVPSGVTVLSYEELCLNTARVVDTIFQDTLEHDVSLSAFGRDSSTTDDVRERVSAEERVNSWKSELSPQHRSDIEKAMASFDIQGFVG